MDLTYHYDDMITLLLAIKYVMAHPVINAPCYLILHSLDNESETSRWQRVVAQDNRIRTNS